MGDTYAFTTVVLVRSYSLNSGKISEEEALTHIAPRSPVRPCDEGSAGSAGPSGLVLLEVPRGDYGLAKSSVAWTRALRIPGSLMLWPASGTITSFDLGHRLCSAHALAAGHTRS